MKASSILLFLHCVAGVNCLRYTELERCAWKRRGKISNLKKQGCNFRPGPDLLSLTNCHETLQALSNDYQDFLFFYFHE
jgi:hypothetical protein